MTGTSDEERKASVLEAVLGNAGTDGFADRALTRAGTELGIGCETMLRLFPDKMESLVDYYFARVDAQMERALAGLDLPAMKVRERIAAAVLARLDVLRPHKEAARHAAAFLMRPEHAGLALRLLYRAVDAMWRAVGDTSTDFNFYTKRAILAGVYSATLARWFNDSGEDETATREFLAARIENVMQFERLKAAMRERAKRLPSLSDLAASFSARRP